MSCGHNQNMKFISIVTGYILCVGTSQTHRESGTKKSYQAHMHDLGELYK